jgi:hypothetical protein
MISKICTRCKTEKEIDKFPNQAKGKNGKASECQKCYSERNAIWKTKNADQLKKYKWKFNFNLTPEDYNKMFEDQHGCCAVCKRHQCNFTRRLCVDHCHITGKVRGLLCGGCNTAQGLLKEDIDIIDSLKEYINKNKYDSKSKK